MFGNLINFASRIVCFLVSKFMKIYFSYCGGNNLKKEK